MGLSENRLTPKLSLLKLPFWEASDFFRQTTKTVEFLGHPSPTGLLKDEHAAHSTCRTAWHGVETPGTIGRIEMPRDPWSHTHQEQGKNTIKYSRAGNTVLTSFQVLRNNKLGIPSFQSYNLPKTDSPGAYVQNCEREALKHMAPHWTIGQNQQILTKLKYFWCAYEGSMKKTTIFGLLQDLQSLEWPQPTARSDCT